MRRKGQAAMEFLMTYGWAILAAIIAIGVLAYFGVFNPGKYAPTGAVLTPPFKAVSWNVQNSTGVNLDIQNNGGDDVTLTSVSLTNVQPSGVSCSTNTTIGSVSVGSSKVATIPCTGLASGQNFKADISITYTKGSSTVAQTSTGSIADRVTA